MSAIDVSRRVLEWSALSDEGLRLRCGEMSEQEVRTTRAVLNALLGNDSNALQAKLSDLCDESLVLMRQMFAEQYRLGFEYACEQAGVNCVNKEKALATILRPIPPDELRAMMVYREKLEQEKQTNG